MAETSSALTPEARRASIIESILLVAAEPVSTRALARLLEIDARSLDRAVDVLTRDQHERGIRVQVHQGRLQLVTAPENAEYVRGFLQLPRQPKLSRPSLETLAVVAYRQPVTRSEIEQIRGVGVDRILSNLQSRGWIEESGRRESPGRPIEYSTTSAFLDLFGLMSLDELPAADDDTLSRVEQLSVFGLQDDMEDADLPESLESGAPS